LLVLARRSEDAPVVLAQRTINWPVFPTPIRVAALAQVVHRLVGLHVEANP